MNPTALAAKLLRRNARNPALAWRLLRHLLSSSTAVPLPSPRFLASLSRFLAAARMLPELHQLRRLLLLPRHPPAAACAAISSLISASASGGFLDDAIAHFRSLRSHFPSHPPSARLYNTLLECSLRARRPDLVEVLYSDMLLAGVPPETYTFNLLILSLCDSGMLEEARALVELMKGGGCFTSLVSYNIWLSGLVKCGRLLEAQQLLKEMVRQGMEPNLYSYNIVINGLCKEGMIPSARSVMSLMRSNGISPDTVTYSSLLHWYCTRRNVSRAIKILHKMTSTGCFPNCFTCNILLQSLWKEGKISEAEKLLQKMNEKRYRLDIVTCSIIIDGLCENGKLDKAMEIVDGMWQHGSAALGELGNAFLGLVDDTNVKYKCPPNVITYSILINHLCKAGRLDEAKKLLVVMIGKNLTPDAIIYDTFVYGFCKQEKISSAFKVLRDMEKKGCRPSTRTYNLLIWGLGKKNQIDEILELMKEMKQKEIPKDTISYNNLINVLCDREMVNKAASLLEEMLQNAIFPNVASFSMLIKAFCKSSDFSAARVMFHEALTACGEKEVLYSLMCNQYCMYGKVLEAKEILQVAIEKGFSLEYFPCKNLIEGLCKDRIDDGNNLLNAMVMKGYLFDPATFMPVIDALGKRGSKREADRLSEMMMDMAAHHYGSKVSFSGPIQGGSYSISQKQKQEQSVGSEDWRNLLHRDDGSGIAVKVLKRVQRGWGQGSIPAPRLHDIDLMDDWEYAG
ncbi:pentatricopeptide repeat-containing protein [Canna indica]|uniref:Pentatricopeptide repeat-containing protein n=1 Tax=Canna indica TaxID=4628 RepID=A0AAQ3JPN2_9LILI|nr:pentatricopeptide repeat-containing protein [Canna indica]